MEGPGGGGGGGGRIKAVTIEILCSLLVLCAERAQQL